jgi:hypothetical protein
VKAMNAGLHDAGRFALLTLARLGIAAGALESAAWPLRPPPPPCTPND